MDFNSLAGLASIISLLLGIASIGISSYAIKKVNKYTNNSKDITNSRIKVDGFDHKVSGRDISEK